MLSRVRKVSSPSKQPDPTQTGSGSAPEPIQDAHRPTSRHSQASRNERSASRQSVDYDIPESYGNLDDVQGPTPVQNPNEDFARTDGIKKEIVIDSSSTKPSHVRRNSSSASTTTRETRNARRRSSAAHVDYDIPDEYANLDEVADISPVQNPDESPIYHHKSLEEARSHEKNNAEEERQRRQPATQGHQPQPPLQQEEDDQAHKVSRLATQLYTIAYLVLFSLLGTLARLGLQAITTYTGSPTIFSSLWPNFGGSLFMGFLAEDRMFFRWEWGTPTYEHEIEKAKRNARDEESGESKGESASVNLSAAKKAHVATKKTIPLYIGLATGFCGSFTSFSSFIRDSFLALSNDLPTPGLGSPASRNGGYSFMAVLAVLLVTVSLSLSGLFIGAHLAIALEPITPSLPYHSMRKVIDRLAVFLAVGCWIGAMVLSIVPPDRSNGGVETWRGGATFALVFAPLGCLGRFYASLYLNSRKASFPLGTFIVNMVGTAVLGMCWDLAHVPEGGVIGCQVLQGIEDGFCGCLTTVSTWVAELAALRRHHAYMYGGTSFLVALATLVAIIGGLRWSEGFSGIVCYH